MSGTHPPDDAISSLTPAPTAEPRGSTPRPAPQTPLDYVSLILASTWLILPAFQYFGTFQRTSLQIEGSAPQAQFATLDVSMLYVLLLAATLVVALVRWLNRDQHGATGSDLPNVQPEAIP
jgi:hypothetical protein